ncbi:MAG: acylphosphatase [Xenococcaceae cyanobacterium MO_207.B15]|nr:acylphosphatase [Xenococcaceae cyanobacterium MO_207.B15]MDJ0743808.1 acylphosphatase [Xenococcaceae cyanobacterium MO_167.B27]
MKKIKAVVSGKVQGVGFRMFILSQAIKLGVRGYVQNLRNGDVEIVAFGEDKAVDDLMDAAQSGSPSAVVSNLKIAVITDDDEKFEGFEIRR